MSKTQKEADSDTQNKLAVTSGERAGRLQGWESEEPNHWCKTSSRMHPTMQGTQPTVGNIVNIKQNLKLM